VKEGVLKINKERLEKAEARQTRRIVQMLNPDEKILGVHHPALINWWWRFILSPVLGLFGLALLIDSLGFLVTGEPAIQMLAIGLVLTIGAIIIWPSRIGTRKSKPVIVTTNRIVNISGPSVENSILLSSVSSVSTTTSSVNIKLHSGETVDMVVMQSPKQLQSDIMEGINAQNSPTERI
jgi:hypothetical protein